jgi:ketosteroid isomerase-like protein
MSQENVELVRKGYAALNRALSSGDYVRAVQEFMDPEVVLKPAGLLPESSEMHGHEGMVQFLTLQTETFDAFRVEAQEFIDAGSRVVVPIHFGGRATYSGLDVAFDVVHVCSIKDAKITRVDIYRTKAEALKATGLIP